MIDCPKNLYHYTSINSLASILKNETIKFNNLTKVDDLEESKYSEYGKYVFVSCWTEKENEDIPTWIMYGNKMNGVRIKLPIYPFLLNTYTPDDFRSETPSELLKYINIDINESFFKVNDFINNQGYMISPSNSHTNTNIYNDCYKNILFKIEYTDDENVINYFQNENKGVEKGDFLSKLGFRKRNCWEFQKEWRYKIVFAPFSAIDSCRSWELMISRIAQRNNLPFDSYYIKIDPKYLKNLEITMGPCTTDSDWHIVEQLLKSKGLNPREIIKHSSLEGKIRNFL
ncbi:MAG: hypothetical protein EOM05_01825 [Clostridia bacterium]|nr:hypothetical protein [Clostridia bacterium]